MTRRKWLWTAALAVPLIVAGTLYAANTQKATAGYTCPITGENLPCSKCCPLNGAAKSKGFTCPVTGENLPCERCCPLNDSAKQEVNKDEATNEMKRHADQGFVCPVTGEELACEKCCPLSKAKTN
ncbi:MAG: hypothetical protein K2X38_12210 [Gemmataceae bacterium]|nr:hypothetical protein [Gemmataceae bacterium]